MKQIIEYIFDNLKEPKKYIDAFLLYDDKILILRRANYMKKFKSLWGVVGGSIEEKDKDSKSAAIREIKEETGIELSFNEERKMKLLETIKHEDNSTSDIWVIELESKPEVKISREHSKYEWFNEESDMNKKWMPDIFQIIQKILDK